MTKDDLDSLSEVEREYVDASFSEELAAEKKMPIWLGAVAVLGAMMVIVALDMGMLAMAALLVVSLLMATVEKLTYHHQLKTARSTIVRLVRRLESVEKVPQTPMNGRPSMKPMQPQLGLVGNPANDQKVAS